MDENATADTSLEHGRVEIFLVALPGTTIDPQTLDALTDLVDAGTLDVVDLLVATRDEDGVTITEFEQFDAGGELPEPGLSGLLSEDDLVELTEALDPGTSAAVVVVEHVWARDLASRLAAAGGVVVATERIPAPAVNELVGILQG